MLTAHAVSLNSPVVTSSLRRGFVCVALDPKYELLPVELLVMMLAQFVPS
jgi:hypothetical protein